MQINSINHLMALLEMAGRGSAVVGQWVFHHTITTEGEPHERIRVRGNERADQRPIHDRHFLDHDAFPGSCGSSCSPPCNGASGNDGRGFTGRDPASDVRGSGLCDRCSPAASSSRVEARLIIRTRAVVLLRIATIQCCDGFGLEPLRLQHTQLPDTVLRDVLAPLRDRTGRDFEQLGQGCGIACLGDGLVCFHGN